MVKVACIVRPSFLALVPARSFWFSFKGSHFLLVPCIQPVSANSCHHFGGLNPSPSSASSPQPIFIEAQTQKLQAWCLRVSFAQRPEQWASFRGWRYISLWFGSWVWQPLKGLRTHLLGILLGELCWWFCSPDAFREHLGEWGRRRKGLRNQAYCGFSPEWLEEGGFRYWNHGGSFLSPPRDVWRGWSGRSEKADFL